MAIEFDLKITKDIKETDFIDKLNKELNKLFKINHEFSINNVEEKILDEKTNLNIEIDKDTSVIIMGYDSLISSDEDDGGIRLNISIGHNRTRTSFVLSLIISKVLIEIMNTNIIDDSLLLKKGRIINSYLIDEILKTDNGLKVFSENLCKNLGLNLT